MGNFEKPNRNYVKSTGQAFMTGHYISNLYNSNYILDNSDLEQPNSDVKNRLELANFVKIYLDFAYYLCLSPFRCFKAKKEDGESKDAFSVYTWLPQQLVCGIMHTLCLLRIITEARESIPTRADKYAQNPAQYFILIMNIFNLTYKAVFMKRLWWNRSEFLQVVNYISREGSLPYSKYGGILRRATVIRIVLALYTSMGISSIVAGKYFLPGTSGWTPTWWYRRIVMSTRYAFFYGDMLGPNDAPDISSITLLDQLLLGVNIFGLISRYLLGFYTDLGILTMTLTLWSVSYLFGKSVSDDYFQKTKQDNCNENSDSLTKLKREILGGSSSILTWQRIYNNFQVIRLLSYLINNALGSIVCWFLGDAIMAYSVHMDALLIARDFYKRFNLLFYYFCTFGILIMAADICKQMEAVKLWLAFDDNRKSVPSGQVSIVLHEMLAKDVGIRGSNIFTITYPIAATFIGTIVTYFIICVQQNPNI